MEVPDACGDQCRFVVIGNPSVVGVMLIPKNCERWKLDFFAFFPQALIQSKSRGWICDRSVSNSADFVDPIQLEMCINE
jgi:hypothetical protein